MTPEQVVRIHGAGAPECDISLLGSLIAIRGSWSHDDARRKEIEACITALFDKLFPLDKP